ncbi:transcription elongation factor [Tropilaelaps mercedesae]|uniref:Transcription elongation factor n=1 Tax=Tropilaelaps mercedesae TaxID=418985 RepID=A0A1V9X5F0_9ACAR|nr:transcription elongation factor [Tropilaelaps mercedesae]
MMLSRKFPTYLSQSLSRGLRQTTQLPYTSEQQYKVLDVLNTSSEKELRKWLGPSLVMRIIDQREENGPFKSLESLFGIKGVKESSLFKLCEFVLFNRKEEKVLLRHTCLTPALPDACIESIQNVVGLVIEPSCTTCAVMDRTHHLLKLGLFDSRLRENTRLSIPLLYEVARDIYPKIIHDDAIFVMEQYTLNLMPKGQYRMAGHLLQSMIYTMLNFGEPDQPKVFQIKPQTLTNLFSLRVGSERIGCELAVRSLIDNGEVLAPEHLVRRFDKETTVNREYLGLSILRSLAILRLCNL